MNGIVIGSKVLRCKYLPLPTYINIDLPTCFFILLNIVLTSSNYSTLNLSNNALQLGTKTVAGSANLIYTNHTMCEKTLASNKKLGLNLWFDWVQFDVWFWQLAIVTYIANVILR